MWRFDEQGHCIIAHRCHIRVTPRDQVAFACSLSYPARSHTACWRAMGVTVSLVFFLSNAITYHLPVGEDREE